MALTNMPRGLTPVGTVTGAAFNESGRLYAIPTSDTSNSYAIGDIVGIAVGSDTNGVPYVAKYATGSAPLPLGVIVGVRVADPGVSLVAANLDLTTTYINAGTRTAVRYVYVVDDPNVIFQVQSDATGIKGNQMHNLCTATITASVTLTGYSPFSTTVVTGPTATNTVYSSASNTLFQIIGAPQDPVTQGALGAVATTVAVPYVNVLVKWNQHQYAITNAPGI